jgi:hypothetical protein
MRTLKCVIALLALLVVVPVAQAAPIVAGDTVTLADGPGNTGGGEFWLTVNGNALEKFITFCLQKTEYIDFTNTFIVGSVNDYTLTDPLDRGGNALGQDFISSQTAWLYTQASNGTLTGYDHSQAAANALQHAFWGLEGEEALDLANPFVALANANTPIGFTSDVKVLNLYRYDASKPGGLGAEAQDQLAIVKTPEPSTLALLAFGLVGVSVRRRQQARVAVVHTVARIS